ncbi:plasmid replication initiator TrfA [Paraburkholderia atlantica]|uniref:plasmid replication initiator TrfA n=1 Tax=Paraburkholderia atlantica TaxID=2654982 RepID=UPI001C3784C0|nr:plasmid replication initiator TrfA [Paraburkholderia atlantica]
MTERIARNTSRDRAGELRVLAVRTAEAALGAAPGHQSAVLDAAERLDQIAGSLERKAAKESAEPAIVVLPPDATVEEVRNARRRQATRRGADVYLPSWSDMAQALPNAFLRSALFGTGRRIQAENDRVLSGDQTLLVAGKEVATFQNLTLTFSGHELCQFDRQVYATCLDYYRERPLCPDECPRHVRTSFYEFACRMGTAYSVKAHRAIRASLLRLSFAQMRLRYQRMNIEVPKLLSVTFEDGEAGGDFKGSDMLLLRVTASVAELFGPGAWTAVAKEAVGYDGLTGWLASFYASHSTPRWLSVESLFALSGYESHFRNFKASLVRALEKLKDEKTPLCSRVASYYFSKDGTKLYVIRSEWRKDAPQ